MSAHRVMRGLLMGGCLPNCRLQSRPLRPRRYQLLCAASVASHRHQSTAAAAADYIPAPPQPPGSSPLPTSAADTWVPGSASELAEPLQQLNALGEPSLASLGLGGYWPPGLAQQCFEFLHVSGGLPWFGAIAAGTVILRLCVFPLVVKAQRNAVHMNNNLPQMQRIQLKMSEARQMGNEIEAARWSNELVGFMKEKNINPIKNLVVPMAQLPIFVSVFLGLRRMANLPLVSMKIGGALWFVDLTVPDPYLLLPAITSLTLLATIELGVDGARVNTGTNTHLVKYFLRALPFIIFPFTINFPAAILCYWTTSNTVALCQAGFLKVPAVRQYFNIPEKIHHAPDKLPIKKKSFVGGVKDSWSNMKIARELEDRQRYDEMRFKKAGLGPVVKTYKHDPTKGGRSAQ